MERENKTPLLSIIISTRNRVAYCIAAIQSILKIPDPELELVIQDNSDSRDLESFVRDNIDDKRLCYRYSPSPLSSVDNFNAAMELSKGEYLCMIGDDDGVNPEIVEAAHWAKENDLDALRPNLIASYFWPDMAAYKSTEIIAGKLFIRNFSGSIDFAEAEKEMVICAKNAGQRYLDTNLPKIYHGIVRKRCMDDVFNQLGTYFKGLSPDIFGTLVIANRTRKMCFIDYPLTISGTSMMSAAGDASVGKHTGLLNSAPHFRNRNNYLWDHDVPPFYSVQTIWAESALVALKETRRYDLLEKFNIIWLHAFCLISHPNFYSLIMKNLSDFLRRTHRKRAIGFLFFSYYLAKIFTNKAVKSTFYRCRSKFSKSEICLGNVNNIEEATESLLHYLDGKRFHLSNCINKSTISRH